MKRFDSECQLYQNWIGINSWLLFSEFLPKMNEMNNKCIKIPDEALVNLNSRNYLEKHDFRVPWDLLLEMKLSFSITTKTLKRLGPISGPECFKFHIDINFVNDDHDGQVIFTFSFNIFLRNKSLLLSS